MVDDVGDADDVCTHGCMYVCKLCVYVRYDMYTGQVRGYGMWVCCVCVCMMCMSWLLCYECALRM